MGKIFPVPKLAWMLKFRFFNDYLFFSIPRGPSRSNHYADKVAPPPRSRSRRLTSRCPRTRSRIFPGPEAAASRCSPPPPWPRSRSHRGRCECACTDTAAQSARGCAYARLRGCMYCCSFSGSFSLRCYCKIVLAAAFFYR